MYLKLFTFRLKDYVHTYKHTYIRKYVHTDMGLCIKTQLFLSLTTLVPDS